MALLISVLWFLTVLSYWEETRSCVATAPSAPTLHLNKPDPVFDGLGPPGEDWGMVFQGPLFYSRRDPQSHRESCGHRADVDTKPSSLKQSESSCRHQGMALCLYLFFFSTLHSDFIETVKLLFWPVSLLLILEQQERKTWKQDRLAKGENLRWISN